MITVPKPLTVAVIHVDTLYEDYSYFKMFYLFDTSASIGTVHCARFLEGGNKKMKKTPIEFKRKIQTRRYISYLLFFFFRKKKKTFHANKKKNTTQADARLTGGERVKARPSQYSVYYALCVLRKRHFAQNHMDVRTQCRQLQVNPFPSAPTKDRLITVSRPYG